MNGGKKYETKIVEARVYACSRLVQWVLSKTKSAVLRKNGTR